MVAREVSDALVDNFNAPGRMWNSLASPARAAFLQKLDRVPLAYRMRCVAQTA